MSSAFFAHPTAVVEPGAEIGAGSRVWHHAHVMAGARVGEGCVLGKDVFVGGKARVGDRVKIQNGVSVYDGVTLEDEVFVGPHAVFTNVTNPRAFIDRRAEIAPTRVARGATIGAGAVIVCGHTIGEHAFVAAGAVVSRDVAPHALVMGNPARRVGWVSRAGRRLPDGREVACPETGERYVIDGERCVLATERPRRVALACVDVENQAALPELRAALDRVVHGGQFVLGREVEALERELADRLRVPHAVAVSSGSDALLVTLMALGVGPGAEVVTTAFTFFATVGAILRLGATPVFADIDPETYCLDVAAVERALSPATKVILPVSLYGRPLEPALFALAERRGIPVVEDAAQSLGAVSASGPAGTSGLAGCFSFFPTKNLGALGDAGLVVTKDDALAKRLRLLRVHGAQPKYHHVALGGNFRLDALQAAFLRAKLPRFDEHLRARRDNARFYEERFASLVARGALQTPGLSDGHAYHQYVVRTSRRSALAEHLSAAGIETAIYYPEPLHRAPAVLECTMTAPELPHTERAAAEVLALPIHPFLTASERDHVAAHVEGFFGPRAAK